MAGTAIAFGLAAIASFLFGPPSDALSNTAADEAPQKTVISAPTRSNSRQSSATAEDEILLSPMAGQLSPLANVSDPMFASGVMGQGVAITPSGNQVVAPASGIV